MSLDLAWDKLDDALAQKLVDILNKSLTNAPRPSFIGPVEVTGLEFGTVPPDIEVVDLRNVYRDFLEDDEEDDEGDGKRKVKGKAHGGLGERLNANGEGEVQLGEEEYEWVSRRDAELAAAFDKATYHPLMPHMRYNQHIHQHNGGSGGGGGMAMSVPNLADLRPGLGVGIPRSMGMGMSASMYSAVPASSNPEISFRDRRNSPTSNAHIPPSSVQAPSSLSAAPSSSSTNSAPTPVPNADSNTDPKHPNIQIHLRIVHHSDLRLSLTTSLLINYPSLLFLSLPIKLAVTGLEFNGEVALAYEGASSPRRIHFCILDDLDPYGLATSMTSSANHDDGFGGGTGMGAGSGLGGLGGDPAAKPLPVGQRLLPSIFIESEIGQADKHLLRNVTRVEKFIQDVIRKTVEDELVFPNFHTIVLPE